MFAIYGTLKANGNELKNIVIRSSLFITFSFFLSKVFMKNNFEFVLLGTGTSEGIPTASCLIRNNCETCSKSMEKGNINRRFNTGAIIRFIRNGEEKIISLDISFFFKGDVLN